MAYPSSGYSDRAFASSASALNSTSWLDRMPAAEDNRATALEKAYAWTDRAVGLAGAMSEQGSKQLGEYANFGLNQQASAIQHEYNVDAAKAALEAQESSGIMGAIGSVVGLGASLLCERRYKQDIEPLAVDAWSAVRDLPLYSFAYRMAPGKTVYGPMVDEVESIDPSLVRTSLFPDDEQGPVRGFDVMRFDAYETLALQQALQRIEQLEARLQQLEQGKPSVASPFHPQPVLKWTPLQEVA